MASKILSYKQLELVNALEKARESRIFAVVDARLKNMLPQWLQYAPDVYWMHKPEEQKNLDSYAEAVDFFLKQGIQRGSTFYAIGGGATTDFGGYIAGTLFRGIPWIAVPTTLIGMVDAAIGGKTALNTKQGKNQVGVFHFPKEVWICGDFLRTLTSGDILSGKGEILKYGLLSDDMYKFLTSKRVPMDEIVLRCAAYKQEVVARDPLDQGERVFLNLGHTVGHALEHALRLPHGVAVAMGMRYLFKALALKEALTAFDHLAKQLDMDSSKLDLSSYARFDHKLFWGALGQDKKRVEQSMNLVVLDGVGLAKIQPMALNQLRQRLETLDEFRA